MALLSKFKFLGPLPTLRRGPAPEVKGKPPEVKKTRVREPENSEAEPPVDWHDPELPLDALRDEAERRGLDWKKTWNRATLLKHLDE